MTKPPYKLTLILEDASMTTKVKLPMTRELLLKNKTFRALLEMHELFQPKERQPEERHFLEKDPAQKAGQR